MARVTVEDCLENVCNRFDLVIEASKRARELAMGSEATLPWENDKPTVMALREIADGYLERRAAEDAARTPESDAMAAFGLTPEGEDMDAVADDVAADSEETPAASEAGAETETSPAPDVDAESTDAPTPDAESE